MTPEQAVRERILDISSVSSLVSGRVRLLRLQQHETLPAVRVQLISEPTSYHARGGSGMYRSRIQVDSYAKESSGADPYAAVTELSDAIHGDDAGGGLSGWTGVAGGSPGELTIHAIMRVDRDVSYESEELRQVRCRQDYMVHWSRVAPSGVSP